jgi:Cd2+/Zn2+-exporting ATPase
LSKKQKRTFLRILLGALLFVAALLIPQEGIGRLFLFLPAYLVVGGDVLWKACRHIAQGQVFDENFLMSIATMGAFFVGEYPEGVAVMLFYQVGELFQNYAVSRSRQSISTLMDIRPDYANIPTPDGLKQVDPEEVAVGDRIVIKAGEKVPLDGRVLEGGSTLDTSALTGEALPREVEAGDSVISGCINLTGMLTVEVTREFGESTVAKILDLVENAGSKKSKGGKLYYQICPLVYACRRHRRGAAGIVASADPGRRACRLGAPRADLFGHFLPLRAGDFCSTELFRRNRRRVKMRRACKGKQLSGSAGKDRYRCF